MPPTTELIASLTAVPDGKVLQRLSDQVDWLEVRADLVEGIDPAWLRQSFQGRLLYTYRSRVDGGEGAVGGEERRRRLVSAVESYDLVDLELRDLEPATLGAIPAAKRLISWHGSADSVEELGGHLERLREHQAHWYKLVPWVDNSGPDRWPLILLKQRGRGDLISFAAGTGATWTRLLSAHLGAPAMFVAAGEELAAPGQLPVDRLIREYGWPLPERLTALFGVVGNPVGQSLSPCIHNRALRREGLPGLYLPFHVEHFGDFWLEVVEEGGFSEAGCVLRGLSITAPAKKIAMAVAGATSPLAERIASANTMLFRDGVWEADSTDPEGVLGPLRRRRIGVRDRACAVLGAGGAGRAAAFALSEVGGRVTIFNRGEGRGRRAAELLKLPWALYDEFDPADFDVVVQATSLGRSDADPLPSDPTRLPEGAVGIDLVYRRGRPTPWVHALRECGHTAIDGREVLLHQAVPQFAAMTGREMPSELVAELLEEMNSL